MCIGLCQIERVNCLEACEEDILCQSECFRNYQPCIDGESTLTPLWTLGPHCIDAFSDCPCGVNCPNGCQDCPFYFCNPTTTSEITTTAPLSTTSQPSFTAESSTLITTAFSTAQTTSQTGSTTEELTSEQTTEANVGSTTEIQTKQSTTSLVSSPTTPMTTTTAFNPEQGSTDCPDRSKHFKRVRLSTSLGPLIPNSEYNPESILILYTNPQNGVSQNPLILSPDGAINEQLQFSMDFDLGTRVGKWNFLNIFWIGPFRLQGQRV